MGLIVVPPEVLPGRFTMVFRPKDRLLNSMGHSYTVHRQIGEKEKQKIGATSSKARETIWFPRIR